MKSVKNLDKIRYPDARVKAIRKCLEIIQNEHDWEPEYITKQTFETLGIAPSKETNVIFALKFLGIINGNGKPTEEFFNLREDYAETLKRLVRSSYSDVFNIIPINLVIQRTLVNYFMNQGYVEDTAEYQAKLFVTLCQESGIELRNVEDSFKRSRYQN